MPQAPRIAPAAALLAFGVALSLAPPARAAQYERTILIDTELDLYELQLNGEISGTTLETLVELFRVGLDLNGATRDELYVLPGVTYPLADAIISYRNAAGGLKDPAQLVAAGVVPIAVMDQMAPFLVVGRSFPVETRNSGSVRLLSSYSLSDPLVPPTLVQARFKGLGNFSAGLGATLNRQRLNPVTYDAAADSLFAVMPPVQPNLPRFFGQWDSPELKVVGGTFRLGFGQRLTLDNTSRISPDGVYADDQLLLDNDLSRLCRQSGATGIDGSNCSTEFRRYASPDVRWNDVFRGLAVQLKGVKFGDMQLKATAFGSYQARNVYQYYIFNKDTCVDPRDPDDPGCKAPTLLAPVDDASGIQPRWAYLTLPSVVDELAGGGNVTLSFQGRGRVGLTGYGANNFWRVPGANLDFKTSSGTPFGGPYGAVGVDAAWGRDWLDFFIEAARSFDSMPRTLNGREVPGGGGFGVIQRTTMGLAEGQELEVSLRYYDRNYINPNARPIAADDELLGARASNEAGGRVRYAGKPMKELGLRAWADLYTWPGDSLVPGTRFRTNLELFGRADWNPIKPLELALWVQHANKDLAQNGPGEVTLGETTYRNCYDRTNTFDDESGIRVPCSGELYRVGGQAQYAFNKEFAVAARYQHDFQVDQGSTTTGSESFWRQDVNASGEVSWKPSRDLRLKAYVRYLDDAAGFGPGLDQYKEKSLWNYLDVTWQPIAGWLLRGRYDLKFWLDTRATTLIRYPNPENRFRLEIEARF